MRHDPLIISWLVRCPSEQDGVRLKRLLAPFLAADQNLVDVVRAYPDGGEARWLDPHSLGEYFEAIRLLPARPDTPSAFRLVFYRRPDSGRFWKDLMARILQQLRELAPGAVCTRDSSHEQELAGTTDKARPGGPHGSPQGEAS
jgi:hypothetical protein